MCIKRRMETLQAILLALIGAFVGIYGYQILYPKPVQKEVIEVVREAPVLPYWTSYDPGYGYWPRWMDSYWLNYVPFYGPITGASSYGGRQHYLPNHWVGYGRGGHMGGHSGVAVGGGGGGGHGGGGGGHGGH
jgi:uncharacterized membrane protein YgcG